MRFYQFTLILKDLVKFQKACMSTLTEATQSAKHIGKKSSAFTRLDEVPLPSKEAVSSASPQVTPGSIPKVDTISSTNAFTSTLYFIGNSMFLGGLLAGSYIGSFFFSYIIFIINY